MRALSGQQLLKRIQSRRTHQQLIEVCLAVFDSQSCRDQKVPQYPDLETLSSSTQLFSRKTEYRTDEQKKEGGISPNEKCLTLTVCRPAPDVQECRRRASHAPHIM
jgi:hypothetical protein